MEERPTKITYSVELAELTAEMLDELMVWAADRWGLDDSLTTIRADVARDQR